MGSATPSPAVVRETVDDLAPPGTPVTTAEVAEEFKCTSRTIYNKLDALVDDGLLETKKVGARGRVWWRPPPEHGRASDEQPSNREITAEGANRDEGECRNEEPGRRLAEERDMFADGPAVVFRWSPESEEGWPVEYVTENVENVFGYTPEELESGEVPYTDLLLDEELDRIAREVKENSDRMAERFNHEPYRVKTRGGDIKWVKDTTKIVRDASGEVVNYLGYLIDISDRKWNEERQRFLVELNDTVHRLTDPDEIKIAAAEQLGTELGLSQVGYVEVEDDQEMAVAGGEYSDSRIPDPAGHRFRLSDYGVDHGSALRSGENLFFENEQADQMNLPDGSDVPKGVRHRASAAVPLKRDDRLVAWLYATHPEPRSWPEHERRLFREVAERTWDAAERARVEEELKRTNDALERLNAANRELIDADVNTFSHRAAEITGTVLDVEYVTVWRYDREIGELQEDTVYDDPKSDFEGIRCPSNITDEVWQIFLTNEIDVKNNFETETVSTESSLRSYMLIPLGRHGAIYAGSTVAERFDQQTVDLAETLAATIEAAWDRAEGEQRLADHNEQLQLLDQLNSLIREIDQALVEADSIDAIDQAVCELLADDEQYEFAWIGELDLSSGTITPREWAGVDSGYVETLTIKTEGSGTEQDAIAAALQKRELQVVADIAIDPRAAAWREATLERGARSCFAIPLVYNGSLYGVLSVYADHPQPSEQDHTVLMELGETIAYAIDAAETKRTLLTDNVTELTLEIRKSDDILATLARTTGGEVEFDGFVPRDDNEIRLFFTAQGVAVEDMLAAAREQPTLAEVAVLRDDDTGCIFEVNVTEPTIVSQVANNQGFIRSLTATADITTIVVDLPAKATVREFIERLQATYPSTGLVMRQTCDRQITTRQDLQDSLSEQLTDRQREVFETAYRSGFFESPRVRTGEELSEMLDITQSTFSYHLREAERRISELVFENF